MRAARGGTAALAVLAIFLGFVGAGSLRDRPTEAATEPAARREAPTRTTDVGRTRQRLPTWRTARGRRTDLPLLLPPRRSRDRAVVRRGPGRLVLPRYFQPSLATDLGVVGFPRSDPPAVLTVPWDGSRRVRHWEGPVHGSVHQVVPDHEERLWWRVDTSTGDDEVLSWAPDEGVRRHPVDLGPRPSLTATQVLDVVGPVGVDDVALSAYWSRGDEAEPPPEYRRTSGRPAPWPLLQVRATSPGSGLVVGRAPGRNPACLAAHRVDESTPTWTRCFRRHGRPAELPSVDFTSDGSRLVVLVRGGHYEGPASMFHVGRDTLLTLDTADGSVAARVDHNFDRVVLEDDRHVLFVRHRPPPSPPGTDEGPYRAWLVRCSLRGSCEQASRALHADTSFGHPFPVPVG